MAMLSLAAATAAYAQAYRWVDESGIVQYTDRPHPGAVRIELPHSTGQRARLRRTGPGRSSQPADAALDAAVTEYASLSVASPGAEETLWNIGGVLTVALSLQPGLQQGHRVRVYLDGEPRMVSGASFQIPDVFRGVHNIQVEILDQTGKLKIRSQPNRFYVQQNSVTTSPGAGN